MCDLNSSMLSSLRLFLYFYFELFLLLFDSFLSDWYDILFWLVCLILFVGWFDILVLKLLELFEIKWEELFLYDCFDALF